MYISAKIKQQLIFFERSLRNKLLYCCIAVYIWSFFPLKVPDANFHQNTCQSEPNYIGILKNTISISYILKRIVHLRDNGSLIIGIERLFQENQLCCLRSKVFSSSQATWNINLYLKREEKTGSVSYRKNLRWRSTLPCLQRCTVSFNR